MWIHIGTRLRGFEFLLGELAAVRAKVRDDFSSKWIEIRFLLG
jgi:hypothetical protein